MGVKRRRITVIVSRLKAFNFFTDAFTSALNAAWKSLRGAFSVSGGTATTSTPTTSYPLSVVKMAKTNVTAQATNMGQGTGLAIWSTDSGNWWGVVTGQNPGETCNCQTCNAANCNAWYTICNSGNCTGGYNVCGASNCSGYTCNGTQNSSTCNGYTCNAYTCNAYTCNAYACVPGTTYCSGGYNTSNCCGYYAAPGNCKTYNKAGNCASYYYSTSCSCYNGSYCNGYSCAYYCSSSSCSASTCSTSNCTGGWNASTCNSSNCSSWTCNSYSCASWTCYGTTSYCNAAYYYSYTCNCQTCYPAIVRVLRSVSDTVTEVASWTLSSIANSLKVITTGSTVTVRPYSDTNLSTQIGSDLTYTAAGGAKIDTMFGIVVAPSAYNQGNTLDNFTATTN